MVAMIKIQGTPCTRLSVLWSRDRVGHVYPMFGKKQKHKLWFLLTSESEKLTGKLPVSRGREISAGKLPTSHARLAN